VWVKILKQRYNMIKNFIFLISTVTCLFGQNVSSDPEKMQARLWMLEKYEHLDVNNVVDTVKKDMLSKDVLVQDAGCLILLKTLEGLKKGDTKSNFIFSKLSEDQSVVNSVADIIDSRLLGWYNPEASDEIDEDIRIYTPLFIILGRANNKMARYTLTKSILYLRGHPDVLKLIPLNEELAAYSIRRLKDIQSRYCCIYPGKEVVVDMLDKDSRYRILEMFENFLETNNKPGDKMKKEMKEFFIDCMKYGDSKNGYIIRTLAVKLAGRLAKSGDNELFGKIEVISKTDPFYVHAYIGRAGFSLTELNYPVREACKKIINP
jgi:hypothetical protein